MIDVTAILLAHNEGGELVDRALRSLVRSVEYAAKSKISVEILIVLDRPDKETASYFETIPRSGLRKIQVDCGDPGLSRNCGVQSATGRYVTFLDGDNLVSEQWIFRAFRYLEAAGQNIVAHPEYHIFFDRRNFTLKQISSNSPSFKAVNLLMTNFWDTVAMSRKEIYLNNPYVETIPKVGLGYEDWHFDCETITKGIEHHVVPDSVHFMRSKETGSVCKDSLDNYRLLPPTQLLQPTVFKKYYEKSLSYDNAKPMSWDSGRLMHHVKQMVKAISPSIKQYVTKCNVNQLRNALPSDVRKEFNKIKVIEPLIHDDAIDSFCSHEYVDNAIYTAAYYSLCEAISYQTDKFILLICDTSTDHCSKMQNTICDLKAKHHDSKMVIVDTSPPIGNCPQPLTIQDGALKLVNLDESLYNSNLPIIIALFILNANPQSVYLLNSNVANALRERYGNIIKEITSIEGIERIASNSSSETA